MNNKLVIAVALVAGLVGGLLTHYIAPPSAFAQIVSPVGPLPPPPPSGPTVTKEIRAQSFTLVDGQNRTIGTFTTQTSSGVFAPLPPPPPGAPQGAPPPAPPRGRGPEVTRIVLRDSNGREIWSAGDTAQFRQLGQR